MFGTLKPHTCSLEGDGKHEYNSFYCGLCKSLGDGYGTPSRALVGDDAVFLALLVDALVDEPAQPDRCRCPLLPVVHRPTVKPDSVAMRYAAAMQMMLGDQLLADRAAEGKFLAKAVRPLAQRHVSSARDILGGLGIDLTPLDGFEHRQARCEIVGQTDPSDAAAPTAEALSFVFSSLLDLPGASTSATGTTRPDLATLGRAVGEAIYLIDALEDLEKDLADRAFNPCLKRDRHGVLAVDPARLDRCVTQLFEALEILRRTIGKLPLRRHGEVLRNVLVTTLPSMSRRAASRARAFLRSQQDLDVRRAFSARVGDLTGRALHVVFVSWVMLWSWVLVVRNAMAKPRPLPTSTTTQPVRPPRPTHPTHPTRPDAGTTPRADAGPTLDDCDGGVYQKFDAYLIDAGMKPLHPCKDPEPATSDAGAEAGVDELDAGVGMSIDPDASALLDRDAGVDPLVHEAEHAAQNPDAVSDPKKGPFTPSDPCGCDAAINSCCKSACGDCSKPCHECCGALGCDKAMNGCCNACTSPCNDCCKGCGDPCKGCGDPCKGCCNGCDGCCKGCDDPCKGCCNGCNCNGCCK